MKSNVEVFGRMPVGALQINSETEQRHLLWKCKVFILLDILLLGMAIATLALKRRIDANNTT